MRHIVSTLPIKILVVFRKQDWLNQNLSLRTKYRDCHKEAPLERYEKINWKIIKCGVVYHLLSIYLEYFQISVIPEIDVKHNS